MPSHWKVSPLKSLASGEDKTLFIDGDWIETRHLSKEGVRYLTTGNIGEGCYKEQGAGYISPATFEELRCTEVLPGDLLISRLNLPIGRCCVVPDLGTKVVVAVDVVICRLNARVDKQFLKFRLSALDYFHETELLASGATMQRISRTELGNIRLALPPLSEQRTIAAALDREATRIDALIAKKTKFIELLTQKRQVLITNAVTRGLDPKVKMRDSGVDWIGKIPSHWTILTAKRLFSERDERSETGQEELMTVSHITGVTPRSEKNVNMFEAETTEGYKRCHVGDLVINTLWAWMGAMGVSRQVGIVSPAYNVYTPTGRLEPEFIDLIVRLPLFAKEVTRFSKGIWSSRLRLYPEGFFEVRFAVPPLEEQRAIASYIGIKIGRINELLGKTQQSIDLLLRRRSALITAAVTGQIDLRESA